MEIKENFNQKTENSKFDILTDLQKELVNNIGIKKSKLDFIFKENPEIAKLGTKEQYSEYLTTIFPKSKVKKILYHRGPQKIEAFDKSKTKELNWNRFYFSPFDTWSYGQHITMVILNIENLAKPMNKNFMDDINKEHPEYNEGKSKWFSLSGQIYKNADKYGYDWVVAYEEKVDHEYSVSSPEQIHILGSKKDLKQFKQRVEENQKTK